LHDRSALTCGRFAAQSGRPQSCAFPPPVFKQMERQLASYIIVRLSFVNPMKKPPLGWDQRRLLLSILWPPEGHPYGAPERL